MEESSRLKTNSLLIPAAIVVAGALIGGGLLIGLRSGPTSAAAPTAQPVAQAADVSKVKTTSDPFMGNVSAPATMAYWYDYQCPFCQRNEEETMPSVIKDYVDTGKLKIVFKDYQFLGPDSQTLGKVSRAVWETVPSKFYQWHQAIFDNQGTENTGWATKAKILSITTSVLGAADAQKVMALAEKNASEYQKEMDADKTEGTNFGISGTPGFIIGKQRIDGAVPYAQIKAAIDAALK